MSKTVLFLFCQLTLYIPLAIFVIFTCITHVVIYVKIWIILVNDIFQMLVTMRVLKRSFSNFVVWCRTLWSPEQLIFLCFLNNDLDLGYMSRSFTCWFQIIVYCRLIYLRRKIDLNHSNCPTSLYNFMKIRCMHHGKVCAIQVLPW